MAYGATVDNGSGQSDQNRTSETLPTNTSGSSVMNGDDSTSDQTPRRDHRSHHHHHRHNNNNNNNNNPQKTAGTATAPSMINNQYQHYPHHPKQRQYPPERPSHAPKIIRHEELIPLTDHSSSRSTQSSKQKRKNKNVNAGMYHYQQFKDDNPDYETFRDVHAGNPDGNGTRKGTFLANTAILASILTIILCGGSLIFFWIFHVNRFECGGAIDVPDTNNTTNSTEEYFQKMLENSLRAAQLLYDESGRYVLEDYDTKPPFSDFLPALAGYYGKPIYAFYINRGQGIASFGIESKDYPIQEFESANKAYQATPLTGFRTFIQGRRTKPDAKRGGNVAVGTPFLAEPFATERTRFFDKQVEFQDFTMQQNHHKYPKRYMYIGSNEMKLHEIDPLYGIETNVTYFTMPEEDFGAFARRTVITNTDKESTLHLSVLDGLARIEPAGGRLDILLKTIGRTLEGLMGVYETYNNTLHMPYYRLSTQPGDDAAVVIQQSGHWCLSVLELDSIEGHNDLLPIIYDPNVIFGEDTTLLRPIRLYSNAISDIIHNQTQHGSAKTPSAFAAVENYTLAPGQSLIFTTYFGKADHILQVPVVARRIQQQGFGTYKMARTREITHQITAGVETHTANPLFDGHVQQMFLDNSLRGGIPSLLGEVDDEARMRNADEDPRLKVYHLFSRIHGDLERDYNDFVIKSTFFSQGPGNFRDVIQNRRSDVIFNPRIGAFNIRTFLSFIQADGYEPLTVEAVAFRITDKNECIRVATRAVGEADGHRAQREALTGILNSGPFRPGQLFLLMEQQHIELLISRQEFIDMVAATAHYSPSAEYTSGFWADHWTYYMDLMDAYLKIYPDWEERILYLEELPYFFSPAFVKPRDQKYVESITFDGSGKHIRQLNATRERDADKVKEIRRIQNLTGWYESECNWQHDSYGHEFRSTPIAKLFLVGTLKFATRDAYGMGIEYEGGRPGWNDANNGLVGMLGSGMPESFELVVLLNYLRSTFVKYRRDIKVPKELYELIEVMKLALADLSVQYTDSEMLYPKVPSALLRYWDVVATAREAYRMKTKVTFCGEVQTIPYGEVDNLLSLWLQELDKGIQRAMKFGTHGYGDNGSFGITPTYFSYNVTKWELTGKFTECGHPFARAREMVVSLFPLFLEGPTRMMKMIGADEPNQMGTVKARWIYDLVKKSPLRDDGLNMYTISASLEGQSFDMGREMAFAPGWLENQSVWLHMSYKFYLELLRHGLFEEFYSEMLSGGILPFMDPNVYKRSLMECSSFIASSAFGDPNIRGRGFLARLSGSTAEYLSMWVLMMIGPNPFTIDPETRHLQMQLIPALPRWLFVENNLDDQKAAADEVLEAGGMPTPPRQAPSGNATLPTVSFKLFGAIDVTYYHNRGQENLFGVPPSRYVIGLRDGTVFNIDGPSIKGALADKIRRVVFVATIEVYFETQSSP